MTDRKLTDAEREADPNWFRTDRGNWADVSWWYSTGLLVGSGTALVGGHAPAETDEDAAR